MILWLLFAFGVAAFVAWMVWTPGASYRGALKPLADAERELAARLQRHVTAIASRQHNLDHPAELERSAQEIERVLKELGYAAASQRFDSHGIAVRNIEVEIAGGVRRDEIVVLGAHYDSAWGAPGANDNGSGVAALLELARTLRGANPARTLRFVWFVNEEPPYFKGDDMGSRRYAKRARERNERIVAMASLETIGYYSDKPGSQRYPFPLGLFYPSEGNFIAFVSDIGSRATMHAALSAFRRHAEFPSEGVAAPAMIPGVDWSDHWSFNQQGYRAFMVTDTALYRYPWYHQMEDTPDKLDYERLARVVRGLHGMALDLARE